MPVPAIVAIGKRGADLALRIAATIGGEPLLSARVAARAGLPAAFAGADGLKQVLTAAFELGRPLVLLMPVGAAVRLLAPLVDSKHTDPPVVVVDEAGQFVVPLLSSHTGGANALAQQVAGAIGAQATLTTAAEASGTLALDLLAQREGWKLAPGGDLTAVTALLVDGEPIAGYQDAGDDTWWAKAPGDFTRYPTEAEAIAAPAAARILITDRKVKTAPASHTLIFRPPTLAIGVGCVRGATADEIDALMRDTLRSLGLVAGSVACLATINAKQDEAGITELAARLGVPVRYYAAAELSATSAPSPASEHALQAVGAPGVCEPAAMLAANGGPLLTTKRKTSRVTIAVARLEPKPAGSLTLVGLGPGTQEGLTAEARLALLASDTVVGYQLYVDFVRPWLGERDYRPHPIGAEIDRCREAIALARSGRQVALVCSGDSGVYGMAGLVLELYAAENATAEADALRVVSGVTAGLTSGAALGAPLMTDYMTVSLSDLMIPWQVIRRRVQAAAEGDLVLVLYNPASARRRHQLLEVVELLMRHRAPETPVGLVQNAGRPGECVTVTELSLLNSASVDMLTTVVVGNSMTRRLGNRLYTQRGYLGDTSQTTAAGSQKDTL